jgi:hypothetical protein
MPGVLAPAPGLTMLIVRPVPRPPSPALLDHAGRNTTGHLIGGDVVRFDDGADDVVRDLPKFLRLGAAEASGVDRREGQAGIVDENVQAGEALQRCRDDSVAFGGPAQIGDERQDMPLELRAVDRRL